MSNKCPNCGCELDDSSTKKLKELIRDMRLVNELSKYLLNDIPAENWHPEVRTFAYNNFILTKL